MKAIHKNLVVILSLLFTLSLIGFAYYLYVLPERVANETHIISLADTDLLTPVMNELYAFSIISLGLGFAVMLLSVFRGNDNSESNVVYIEKFKDKKDTSKTKQGNDEQELDADVTKIKEQLKNLSDPKKKTEKLLSLIAEKVEASQAAFYLSEKKDGKNMISLFAGYAFVLPESQTVSYEYGEGLAGQVAKEKKLINISDVPEGYITILSGLGESKPAHLIILPVMEGDFLIGVAEVASFKEIKKDQELFIKNALGLLTEFIADNTRAKKNEEK
ncbi:MAG: putative methionine-R-sulfoxide reductase with GAF domain [Marivirga sp.]|jgi:putative methionine-R-sulfoxide reductase with GAF domain